MSHGSHGSRASKKEKVKICEKLVAQVAEVLLNLDQVLDQVSEIS